MAFNKKNPTDAIKVRPRFKLYTSLEEKEVSYRQILASRSPIKAIKGGCEVDR